MPFTKIQGASCKLVFCFIFMLFIYRDFAFGQSQQLRNDLLQLKSISDTASKNLAAEKIYMQFDRPYYAVGDTIWFKAWLVDQPSYLLSEQSGLLHVDIVGQSGEVIKPYIFPVKGGLSWGNMSLDGKYFRQGAYIIRAYTNWMRNFGTDAFFFKPMRVAGAAENNWLVTTDIKRDKSTITGILRFTDLYRVPLSHRRLQLTVMEGNKLLHKQTTATDANGLIDMKFDRPQKPGNLFLVAQDTTKERKDIIPLSLSGYQNVELQFMPEGGDLVAGLPARVGFKAIGEDGIGVNVSGSITDHSKQEVATFQSSHNGMGSFYLAPQPGETYTAKVTLAGGLVKEYILPAVKKSGRILQIKNPPDKDSLEVSVVISNDLLISDEHLFLIGKARGLVCYAAVIGFHNVNYISKKIAKNLLPSGITQFILTTTQGQALNRRLVFINHHDDLRISISADQMTFGVKDSVVLNLNVKDSAGRGVSGNFGLSVTDDASIKIDSLNEHNILTDLLLTSDLKGYIESPKYYFQKSYDASRALDNLLLTQGWVTYQALSNPVLYKAEQQFIVRGSVNNGFNKPVKNTHVTLLSKSPVLIMDTITDDKGYFTFSHFPAIDSPIFLLKAVNKNGKSKNVSIHMDELPPPPIDYTKLSLPPLAPWYVNTDSILVSYVKNNSAFRPSDQPPQVGNHHLKEVKIFGKKIVNGSRNLNGPGNADLTLDEKDMEKAGKKSFLQLLEENVKGFREGYINGFYADHKSTYSFPAYFIDMKVAIILIDGLQFYSIYEVTFDEFKRYLQSHTAEDIKGIEVMSSEKFALHYKSQFAPLADLGVYDFIEITTRSGHGPVINNTPGMYLYRPLAISQPALFYKPKYAAKDTTRQLAYRATIDWQPNINTDGNGTATVRFYAGEKPSSYTIIIEGTDSKGNFGLGKQKIVIKKKQETSTAK